MMSFIDLILVLLVFAFTFTGWWLGLIYKIGGLMGVFAGVILASRWYEILAEKIGFLFGNNLNVCRIVSFLVILVVVWKLSNMAFMLLDKIFKILTFIPFLKTINRIVGAVLGFLEGSLLLGMLLTFILKFPIGALAQMINNSSAAKFFIAVAKILAPLLPIAFKQLQNII